MFRCDVFSFITSLHIVKEKLFLARSQLGVLVLQRDSCTMRMVVDHSENYHWNNRHSYFSIGSMPPLRKLTGSTGGGLPAAF